MEGLQHLNKNRNVDKNQATRFILPLVYLSSSTKFPFYLRRGIENCYLYDDDHIILVYELTEDTTDLEEKMKEEELFVESIDIKGENKVGYIFKIPEQYKQDVELFKGGRYSQLSNEMKETILQFWDIDKTENVLQGVLYQTEEGKEYGKQEAKEDDEFAEGEYWPKPKLEKDEYFSSHYQKD